MTGPASVEFAYVVTVPREEVTLAGVEEVLDWLQGIATWDGNGWDVRSRSLEVRQRVDLDPVLLAEHGPEFAAGHALATTQEEVGLELRSRGWEPPDRDHWRVAGLDGVGPGSPAWLAKLHATLPPEPSPSRA